jgi:hypothetical protein
MTKPWFPGSVTVYPDSGAVPKAPHVDPAEEFMPPAIKPPDISEPPPWERRPHRHRRGWWERWGRHPGKGKSVKIFRRPPGKQYVIERRNGFEPVEPSPSPEMHELVDERELSGLGFLDEIPDYVKYGALALAGIGIFMYIRSRKGGKKRR